MKIFYPTMAGRAGKKNTDPIINEKFPIIAKAALKDPILLKGEQGLKVGSTIPPKISHAKKKEEPIMKSMPPVLGFMNVNDGQYTTDPITNRMPPVILKKPITE